MSQSNNLPPEDSKYNLYYRNYETQSIDKDILAKIDWHEQQALELRKLAGMTATVYIPQNHPTVGYKLLKDGRRVLWNDRNIPSDKKSGRREYGTMQSCVRIESDQLERELAEMSGDDYILREIDYNGDPYMKIALIMERIEPIVMVKAHNIHTLLHERKYGKEQ